MGWDKILYYYETFMSMFGGVFVRVIKRFFGEK